MSVREIAKTDCGGLAEIHARCFPASWTAKDIARLAAEPNVLALKAGQDTPCAFLLVRTVLDEAEILTLAVDPSARRCGLARRLLARAESTLREKQISRLFLEVSDKNAPARSLYSAAGFSERGLRAAYYSDGSDALIMEKSLVQ